MNALITDEQKQVLENDVPQAVQRARDLVVRNPEERGLAEIFVKRLREFKEKIEERFHPTQNKKDAYKLYEQTLDTEKAFYVPIDEAIKIASGTVKEYDRLAALRAREAAEKAERERLEAERKERERLEAEALAERLRAEKVAKEAREAAERAAAAKIEADEAKLRQAQAAVEGDKVAETVASVEAKAKEKEAKIETQNAEALAEKAEGSLEKSAVLQDQAETVSAEPKPAPVVEPVKKLIWKAKVVSVKIACRSIGEGLLPFQLVEIKASELNKLGKDYDGKTRIPGIEFFEDVNGRV